MIGASNRFPQFGEALGGSRSADISILGAGLMEMDLVLFLPYFLAGPAGTIGALSYAVTSRGSRRSKHVRRDHFDMKCLQRLYRCCPAIATSWARHRAMDVRCPRPEESDHAAREIHGHRLHGLAYLEAECGIGIHRHRDNQEIFLALRRRYCGGRLKPVSPDVSTGFEIRTMTAGSFSLLKPRALHALFNVTDEDISLLMFGGYD